MLIRKLSDVVGGAHVLTADADTAAFFTDWRRQYTGKGVCVVRPGSTGEVAAVVSLCAAEGIAMVPQGGNTGLCGGSVPTGTVREVVVSMSRMNRIRSVDPLNDTLTAEAGCVLADIQRAAESVERLFPLSLAAQGSCQIGGNLSTNAGGVNVLRYGNAREQVLGLEVVLPDGRVWDGLRGLRKDNTGYDLKQLFIGAEGTLGIVTAAVLRMYPRPRAIVTAWIAVPSPAAAVELLGFLRGRLGSRTSAFELISRRCLDAVLAHTAAAMAPLAGGHDWAVLAEIDDSGGEAEHAARVEGVLAEAIEAGFALDAALAHSKSQQAALWKIRETIPEAQFTNVKHDISVPVSQIPAFIERAGAALQAALPSTPIYCFGHIGDGNLHYNVGDAATLPRRQEVNRIVYATVDALGGSISAEHGLGQLKRIEIAQHKSALELELMRAVKSALDPRGLMNPGKLL